MSTPPRQVERAADRPLRADDAAVGHRLGCRPPPLGLRALPAPTARRVGGTASWPAWGGRSTRSSRSGSPTRSSRCSREQRIVDEPTLAYLADYRFRGDIWGYAEGETYFPYSPLLVVESTFAEAVLLETVLLSIYNHDSAIASAASRMTWAAGERPCIEMGSRRTHEWAAVAAARAAYVAGFAATSNLRARLRLRHPDAPAPARTRSCCCTTPRRDAFRAQVHALGKGTTLLVDTFDIAEAVRLGVEIAGPDLGAVRIDSGDLGRARLPGPRPARRARRDADAHHRDLRPRRVRDRRPLPPRRSTGTASAPSWSPAAATRPAASSTSWSRARTPAASWSGWRRRARTRSRSAGRKYALRRLSARRRRPGRGDRRSASPRRTTATTGRCWCRSSADGEVVGREPLEAARERHLRSRAELPLVARQLSKGEPVIETRFEGYAAALGHAPLTARCG